MSDIVITPDEAAAAFDFSKTYYIAGPMSGIPEFNYPAFDAAETSLSTLGIQVKSPHRNPWPDGDPTPEELWREMMRRALQMLLSCDGMILLPRWYDSKGATLEHSIALAMKMPIYFLLEGVLLLAPSSPASR